MFQQPQSGAGLMGPWPAVYVGITKKLMIQVRECHSHGEVDLPAGVRTNGLKEQSLLHPVLFQAATKGCGPDLVRIFLF